MAHLSAMLGHVGSCWRHLGAILEQLGDKMVNLAGFGQYLVDFFLNLGRDLARNGENQKNDDSTSLLDVFWGPGAALGGYLGSS